VEGVGEGKLEGIGAPWQCIMDGLAKRIKNDMVPSQEAYHPRWPQEAVQPLTPINWDEQAKVSLVKL